MGNQAFPEATRLRVGGIKILSETSVCGDERNGVSFTPTLAGLLSPAGQAWYTATRPAFSREERGIIAAVESMGPYFAGFDRALLPLEFKPIVRRLGTLRFAARGSDAHGFAGAANDDGRSRVHAAPRE